MAVQGASGLPWTAAALLCCAPPLWHVLGLRKELGAPPSSTRPGRLSYPLRSGSLSLLSLSPCPPGIARLLTYLPHLSLSLSNTHTQSFDLDAPTVTHTDPLSHRLNTDDKVPHSLSTSPLSEERLLLATSRGSAIKVSGVSQGSGHPWTAGQCRVQDPKPGSASGTLWITLVKQGIRNL